MSLLRRSLLLLLATFAASPAFAAETWPTRPIKFIVPSAAAGVADLHARLIADKLAAALGQPVVVDNRPGASGIVGLTAATKAAPDGYNFVIGSTSNLAAAPAMGAPVSYDAQKSFEPIALYGTTPMVLVVHPSLNINSAQELIAQAKAKPGALGFASGGPGSTAHFAGELFKQASGTDLLHVPYKSPAQVLAAVLGNEVAVGFDFAETSAPHIQAGKLRALLVTGPRRVGILPRVPTAAEAGVPSLELLAWGGFLAPAGTPREIVARLNTELRRALNDKGVREKLERSGWQIGSGTPDDFRRFIATEQAAWIERVKRTGITYGR
jgi:tripartite-type tricarboxylate transporter receptor subunit TctC